MVRTTEPTKSVRLEARITPKQKALIEDAAQLSGRTYTEFIVAALESAAEAAIERHEAMRLTARDAEILADALRNPPAPGERLKRYARRRQELLGE